MIAARQFQKRLRTGVTLIEMLVVLAIIAILIALLVTAVQRVRSAAAQVECTNNLKQLALAAHQYHNTYGVFPPGQYYSKYAAAAGPEAYDYQTWMALLLPYVDQGPLGDQTLIAFQEEAAHFIDPPHIGNSTVIRLFACPADIYANTLQTNPSGFELALSSYVGVSGLNYDQCTGMLFRGSNIRIEDVTDGTSNTLFIGERPPVFNGRWYGRWYVDTGLYFEGTAGVLMGVCEYNPMPVAPGACPPGYYQFEAGRFGDPCDLFHFWSPHEGGANFAFCDGSVHFLSYGAASIMPALASRAGNETVSIE